MQQKQPELFEFFCFFPLLSRIILVWFLPNLQVYFLTLLYIRLRISPGRPSRAYTRLFFDTLCVAQFIDVFHELLNASWNLA